MNGVVQRLQTLGEAAQLVRSRKSGVGRRVRERLLATGQWTPTLVEEGLRRSMEAIPSEAQIRRLVSVTEQVPRVHVVSAGNVFVATYRALLLALAAAPSVRLKPSRRDPVLAETLVWLLQGLAPRLDVSLVSELRVKPGEALHAYGSDETLKALAASLPPGAGFWPHGHGFGALVWRDQDPPPDVGALAQDIWAFAQRGCLSPRLLLWQGGESAAAEFAARLQQALRVERARLESQDLADPADWQRYASVVSCLGKVYGDAGAGVGVSAGDQFGLLSDCAGSMHLQVVSPQGLSNVLAELAPFITTVAHSSSLAATVSQLLPRARPAQVGRMQQPSLDGPVDGRADFLWIGKSQSE